MALILHADHSFNASTFAARVTASTLSDMHSAVTSAIGALKGPLHGGANEQVMKMLLEIQSLDKAEGCVRSLLAKRKKARKKKGRKADRARVAAGQRYEVYYVARKFGVSADTVRQVIKRVGNSRAKIYAALEKM